MPRRREQLGKKAWEGDPYVPISPEHLRAAIHIHNWTVQKLARATGDHSQTLDHLTKGTELKRCRQSRRARLAKVLKVPALWLGGERVPASGVSEMPQALALPLSPRLQLEVGHLFREAEAALRRDLEQPEVVEEMGALPINAEQLRSCLLWYLLELTRLDQWKAQLTTWRPVDPPLTLFRPEAAGFLDDFPELRGEADERAGLGMVAVLEAALEPWFRGEVALDYNRLRVLVGYDTRGARPGPPHPRYQGTASSPLMMIPQIALGLPE